MKTIVPCLWFDDQAEEAAKFYTSIFENSRILDVARYGKSAAKASGQAEGTAMTVNFELGGQKFMGLNGGPNFKFSEAVSFMINCESQEEVDYFWEKLSAEGEESVCGWLKDKFGLSWQVVPTALGELMSAGDADQRERVMSALMQMKKLDIAALKRAYKGE